MKTWVKVAISVATVGVTATVVGFVVIPWGKRLYAQYKQKKAGEIGGGETNASNQRTDGTGTTTINQNEGPKVGGPRAGAGKAPMIGQPRPGAQ